MRQAWWLVLLVCVCGLPACDKGGGGNPERAAFQAPSESGAAARPAFRNLGKRGDSAL
jgi:hypothetical protein